MIINYHKINLGILRDIFWIPKPLINYFEMTFNVGVAFRVESSPKVTF